MALTAALATPALAQATAYVASPDTTAVETEAGRLVGGLSDGIYRFLGVPYAEADRFMPPRPVAAW